MRDTDTLRAVNRLSLMAQGFGGGTRIAQNLQRFNQQNAAQSVTGRSVVIIFSDGYDTDPPELMVKALARLKRRGCRFIWLNTLKGRKDYAPVSAGMAAALPNLDLFAAANTLDSLSVLEPHLHAVKRDTSMTPTADMAELVCRAGTGQPRAVGSGWQSRGGNACATGLRVRFFGICHA